MPLPENFNDFLNGKGYVIGLQRHKWRTDLCIKHLTNAGFSNITTFEGIDGQNKELTDTCEKSLGLTIHPDVYPGARGATLSMIYIYKDIVNNRLPFALVFEDDALPHPDFKYIANTWYDKTDKNVDFLFLGSQFNSTPYSGIHVVKVTSFCLHAYAVTYEGAQKALKLLENASITIKESYRNRVPGVDVLDLEVLHWMYTNKINWQNWNIDGIVQYPYRVIGHTLDEESKQIIEKSGDCIRGGRDQGLIWQNLASGSVIHSVEIIFANT